MQRVIWLLLTVLACCTGCASPWTVDHYAVPGANLGARHAFFIKGGELGTASPIGSDVGARVDAEIRVALTEGLTRRGYAQAENAAAADLVVSYQVAGSRRYVVPEQSRVGAPSPNEVLSPSGMQPPPASAVPREQSFRDSTVIVFIDDPASGRLVWRGLITAEWRTDSTEDAIRTVARMAGRIVEEFPARQPEK